MIESIVVESFGKFRDTTFDCSGTTVFFGENESGKTTLFDAFLEALVTPKGNTAEGKRLLERYGENRRVEVNGSLSGKPLSPEEFINIFAVRSGDMALDLRRNSWVDAVKSRLFSGGIDPAQLSESFAKKAATRVNAPLQKKINLAKEKLVKEEQKLQELLSQKEAFKKQDENLKNSQENIERLESYITELERQEVQITEMLEQQRLHRQKRELTSNLAKLNSMKEKEMQLSRFAGLRTDESDVLKHKENHVAENNRALEDTQHDITLRQKQLSDLKKEQNQKRELLEQKEREAAIATELKKKLTEQPSGDKGNAKIPVRTILLVLSAFFLIFGVAVGLYIGPVIMGLIAVFSGIGISLLLFIFGWKSRRPARQNELKQRIFEVRQEWKERSGASFELFGESYEDIISSLTQWEIERNHADKDLQSVRELLQQTEAALEHLRNSFEQKKKAVVEAERDLTEWLLDKGVRSVEEYHAKRGEYRNLFSAWQQEKEELNSLAKSLGCESLDVLKVELETDLLDLRNKIVENPMTDAEVRKQQQLHADVKLELVEKRGELRMTADKVSENKGSFRESIGRLPEQIRAAEERVRQYRQEYDEHSAEQSAHSLVAEIFKEIGENSAHQLTALAEKVSGTFSQLVGREGEVIIKQIADKSMYFVDAGGESRLMEHGSKGTVQSFLFAARISMAMNHEAHPGVLFFDEPFESMDRKREKQALKLLKELQENEKWQLIFFTKDRTLVSLVEEIAADAKTHNLS